MLATAHAASSRRTPAPKLHPRLAVALALLFVTALCPVALAQRPPVLITPPQSQLVVAGTNVVLAVVVAPSSTPLTYQWSFDGNAIPGATGATLALTNVVWAGSGFLAWGASGTYTVAVDNGVPPPIIANATLTVVTPVSQSPLSVSQGATLTLSFKVLLFPGLGYQWQFKGTNISRATTTSLIVTNAQFADAGAYAVVVSNATGSLTLPANLSIDPTFTKITTGALVTDAGHWHGAAWGDYNNDGYPDLFVHREVPNLLDIIYRNNGDGTFTRLTAPIPQGLTVSGGAWGNAWGDYDNDGYLDLFISNAGGTNVLLHNRGNGTFEKIASGPGADYGSDSSGPVWGDYDRDGYLDLFVVNGLLGDYPARHWLYHNQGNGTFARMTASQVGSLAGDFVLAVLGTWVDYDENGWPDMFLPTSPARGCFYRNQGDGTFVHLDGVLTASAGALAWADYDNDGRLDVCLGGAGTPTILYHNEGGGTFRKMTAAQVGIPATDISWAGGVAWGDYDNDGYVDLFIGGGFWTGTASSGGPMTTKSFLYHNNGDGTFTRVTTGSPVNDTCESMGVHWVDYDRDGFLDLFVNHHGGAATGPNLLYRNTGNSNNWLCVTCVGASSPRDGTGAKVRALATIRGKPMQQLRLINSGGTCWGGQSFVAHFGLGDATNVDVLRIEWTSGIVQELHNVPVRQYLTVTEPARLQMPQPGQLYIQCWKGMAYRIESSPDLSAWTPLATVTNLNATGGVQWTDPSVPGPSAQFYRVVKQ